MIVVAEDVRRAVAIARHALHGVAAAGALAGADAVALAVDDVVDADERDIGVRQLLNLGHTAAHAIEMLSDFSISHGSAVAIGTILIARAANKMGLCPDKDLDEIINILQAYSLPTECPYNASSLAEIALSDKKRSGGKISLIIPFGIGNSQIYEVEVERLEEIFSKGL